MGKTLLIVESPAKAKTLDKYLGENFTVRASVGHIRDLPQKELGVDIENDFAVSYVTIKGKEKVIKDLKSAAKNADLVLLGPDPDREGEAIAWHVAQSLGLKGKNIKRVLFNEITKRAVLAAVENPVELDYKKFESQQARRILDRLVGYKLSPFLWRKVKPGLSAGRVQSVAVRVVLIREEEIRKFVAKEYWNIFGQLEAAVPPPFRTKLVRIGENKAEVGDGETAERIKSELLAGRFHVSDIQSKDINRKPNPPFTTSTMQQASSSQLRMSPRQTMAVAQQLYEGVDISGEGPEGLITYMRTDAVRIAPEAMKAAEEYILSAFGKDYLPEKPNFYKSGKRAQEAHEAIRPTRLDLPPEQLEKKLSREQFQLYRLIWIRFISSQMAPARFEQKTVEVKSGDYVLAATSTAELFPGHLRVYRDLHAQSDRRDGHSGNGEMPMRRVTDTIAETPLPQLAVGDAIRCAKVDAEQKFTQPPSRYSEASLIRALEEQGIGRPSTYATIVGTILEKGYVEKTNGLLSPTSLGEVVTHLLAELFPTIMDIGFTANMEEELDEVEEGTRQATQLLNEFYTPFSELLKSAMETKKDFKLKGQLTDVKCDKCGSQMGIKFGKSGAFLACSKYPDCKNAKNFIKDETGQIIIVEDEKTEVPCEKCGKPMIKRNGRFGPYLACSGYPDCRNIVSLRPKKAAPVYHVEKGSEPKCSECESVMRLRVSRYGSHFWSCSKYPKCRGTQPYDTGFACMTKDCGGTLIERLPRNRGAAKVPFWACPKCEFVLNERPIAKACPKCAHAYLTEHPVKNAPEGTPPDLVCPGCGHREKQDPPAPDQTGKTHSSDSGS
jgi:DNA topoisomerase I